MQNKDQLNKNMENDVIKTILIIRYTKKNY